MRTLTTGAHALAGLMALEMASAGNGFGGYGRGSGFKVDTHNPDQADTAKKAAEAKRARRNAKCVPVPAVSHLEG
jgi:hypothetical protein